MYAAHSENGSILIVTALLSALLALLTVSIHFKEQGVIHQRRVHQESLELEQHSQSKLFIDAIGNRLQLISNAEPTTLIRPTAQIPGRLGKYTSEANLLKHSWDRTYHNQALLVASKHPPLAWPSIDYNHYFSAQDDCIASHPLTFPTSRALQTPRVKSSRTCTHLPSGLHARLTIHGNLDTADAVSLKAIQDPAILAVVGTLKHKASISLGSDSIIVAAGDIKLKTVENPGSQSVRLTIISARGEVSLSEARGSILTRVFAWRTSSVVGTLSAHGLLPRFSELELLGRGIQ